MHMKRRRRRRRKANYDVKNILSLIYKLLKTTRFPIRQIWLHADDDDDDATTTTVEGNERTERRKQAKRKQVRVFCVCLLAVLWVSHLETKLNDTHLLRKYLKYQPEEEETQTKKIVKCSSLFEL